MTVPYYVDNRNPIVGARNGSRQEMSLYDKDLGNRRIIATTPDKIDEFIAKRKEVADAAKKKYTKIAGIAALASIIPAAVMNFGKNIPSGKRVLGLAISACCFIAGTLGSFAIVQKKVDAATEKLSQEFIEENK